MAHKKQQRRPYRRNFAPSRRRPPLPPPPAYLADVPDSLLTAHDAMGVLDWTAWHGLPTPTLLEIEAERTARGMRRKSRIVDPEPMPETPKPPISEEARANTAKIREALELTPAEEAAPWPEHRDSAVFR